VHVAVSPRAGTWDAATEAATVDVPADEADTAGRSTGIAVTDDGTAYLTWFDPGTGSVDLASSQGGGDFTPIETRSTDGGEWPAVAVTPDGATVFLSWYSTAEQDLAFGTYGETGDLQVAAPSPSLVLASAGPTGGACSADTTKPTTDITVVAPPGAATTGFEQTCIVAPAGEKLSLTFENQDPGGLHNVDFYTAPPPADELFKSGEPAAGPETQTEPNVDPQDPGTFYFVCDVHANMNGTFLVVKASKK
jgi:plastocyanin